MAVHQAGTAAKGDCLVTYEPGDSPLSIVVLSSNGALFRKAIEARAASEASAFRSAKDARATPDPHAAGQATPGGRIEIRDEGALDHVVAARVAAALAAAGLERSALVPGPELLAAKGGRRERPRRSRLYIPGNQPDLQVNAGLFKADCLVLDLEDSVESGRKDEARVLVAGLLSSARGLLGGSELVVRVNRLDSPWGHRDLAALIACRPEALILPKCESADEVKAWEAEVARLETLHGLPRGFVLFMPLVETARGLVHAAEIAAASERNVLLCFGAEDLRSGMGLGRLAAEEELAVARSLVAIAAASAGIEASDSVFSAIDDRAGLLASCERARDRGFSGKGVIHPGQIEAVHRVFSPGAEAVDWARGVIASLEDAAREGRGAAAYEGMMVDAPLLARARRILAALASMPGGSGGVGQEAGPMGIGGQDGE